MTGNPEPLKQHEASRQVPVRIIRALNVAGRDEVGPFSVERPGARSPLQSASFLRACRSAERRAVRLRDRLPSTVDAAAAVEPRRR